MKKDRTKYMRERRQRFLAAGLCGSCGKQTEPNRNWCRRCLDRAKTLTIARRQGLKARGICYQCSKRPVRKPGAAKCKVCAAAETAYLKKQARRWKTDGKCTNCGGERDGKALRCAACRAYFRADLLRVKLACFDHYGGRKCACCGETQLFFLQLDHINGGGARHRKEVLNVYRWLRRKGYPEGFQVLCANCNYGKRMNGGICPHQQARYPDGRQA